MGPSENTPQTPLEGGGGLLTYAKYAEIICRNHGESKTVANALITQSQARDKPNGTMGKIGGKPIATGDCGQVWRKRQAAIASLCTKLSTISRYRKNVPHSSRTSSPCPGYFYPRFAVTSTPPTHSLNKLFCFHLGLSPLALWCRACLCLHTFNPFISFPEGATCHRDQTWRAVAFLRIEYILGLCFETSTT